MKKKRALIVSHSCTTTINQKVYVDLQDILGWDLTLVIPKQWKDEFGNRLDGGLVEGLNGRLIKIPVIPNGNIVLHHYLRDAARVIAEEQPDLIYINHEPYAVATWQWARASVKAKIPYGIYSCQNIWKDYPPPFRWMERYTYRHADFGLPITRSVAEVMRAKGMRRNLVEVPLPIDPQNYRPNLLEEAPEKMRAFGDDPVIGYVGRLVEAKGLKTLAFALGKLRHLNWQLVILGTGDYDVELRAIAKSLGIESRMHFLGYVPHDETPRYLSAMDMLVLPSETQANWKEQFGRVIPEALACGTPVIGSDSGEIPKLIQASGGGLIFPERTPDKLASCMECLLLDQEYGKSLAAHGSAWVNSEMTVSACARKISAVFETVAGKSANQLAGSLNN